MYCSTSRWHCWTLEFQKVVPRVKLLLRTRLRASRVRFVSVRDRRNLLSRSASFTTLFTVIARDSCSPASRVLLDLQSCQTEQRFPDPRPLAISQADGPECPAAGGAAVGPFGACRLSAGPLPRPAVVIDLVPAGDLGDAYTIAGGEMSSSCCFSSTWYCCCCHRRRCCPCSCYCFPTASLALSHVTVADIANIDRVFDFPCSPTSRTARGYTCKLLPIAIHTSSPSRYSTPHKEPTRQFRCFERFDCLTDIP